MGLLSPRTEGFLYFADVVDLFAVASSGGPLPRRRVCGSSLGFERRHGSYTPRFRQETPAFQRKGRRRWRDRVAPLSHLRSAHWSVVLIGHDALTGHLSFGLLWTQHLESRMLVVNAIFVLFARADHLNLRSVVLTSGLFLVVSYGLLLVVFRAYSKRPLTALVVLAIGIVWLSLGDVGNALWAFQLAWYVALLSFTLMVYLLTVSKLPRLLVVCLAAVAGKCSVVLDGARASSRPIGALLILWWTPWTKRVALELGIWITTGSAGTITWRGYRGYHRALSSGRMHREIDVEAERAATPGCAHVAHLNNAGAALPTRATLEAVIGHLRREAERGGYEAATAASAQLEEVLHAVGATDRSRTRRDRAHRLGHPGVDEGDVGVRTRGRHLER